jgi:hypothetical protein
MSLEPWTVFTVRADPWICDELDSTTFLTEKPLSTPEHQKAGHPVITQLQKMQRGWRCKDRKLQFHKLLFQGLSVNKLTRLGHCFTEVSATLC